MRPQTILELARHPFSNRSPSANRVFMSEQVRSLPLHDLSDVENNFGPRPGSQQAFEDHPAAGSDVSDTEHLHTDDLDEASHCATSPGSTRQDRSIHPGHVDQDEAMLTASSAGPDHASIDPLDELLVQVQFKPQGESGSPSQHGLAAPDGHGQISNQFRKDCSSLTRPGTHGQPSSGLRKLWVSLTHLVPWFMDV